MACRKRNRSKGRIIFDRPCAEGDTRNRRGRNLPQKTRPQFVRPQLAQKIAAKQQIGAPFGNFWPKGAPIFARCFSERLFYGSLISVKTHKGTMQGGIEGKMQIERKLKKFRRKRRRNFSDAFWSW